MRHGLGITSFQGVHVGVNPIKKCHVSDRAVFDNFGQSSTEFAIWQSFQNTQIAHYPLRLVKRANHVLAHGVIDGRFAAHGRIDLRQQRCGHLNKGHASHETGGSKARHIADNTTAQCKQNCFAIASTTEQGVKNKVQCDPIFVCLAIWQLNTVYVFVMARQRETQGGFIKR